MEVLNLNPERISMGSINPRQELGDIGELVDSIRQRLEEGKRPIVLPLLVCKIKSETHYWEIIDGKRRLQAALMLGLPEVPVVDESDEKNVIELMFMSRTSNKYRKPMEWWEDADFYIDMNEKHGLSFREIARRENIDESTVRFKVHARKLIRDAELLRTIKDWYVLTIIDNKCPEEEKAYAAIHAIEENWDRDTTVKNLLAMRNFNASQNVVKDFHKPLYDELQLKYYPYRFNPKFMDLYQKEKTLKMGDLGLVDHYLDIDKCPTQEGAIEYAKKYNGEFIGDYHRDEWHLRIYPYNMEELNKKFAELLEKFS